jgi:tape measure domain-containing protein
MAGTKILGSLMVKIGANIEGFISNISKVEKRMEKLSKKFEQTGESLSKKFTLPLLALGGASVMQAAKIETLETAFVSMTGSVEGAKKMMAELTSFAAGTPFEMESIGKAAKVLLAFGTQANDIKPTLKTLGDIAAGTNVPLDEMAQIYGKIQTKGKAMTEEIMQLAERGVPIIDVLAQKFNVTKEEIFKMASDGKISFDVIKSSLEEMTTGSGIFADQMAKQSGTINGLFSTLSDNVKLALAKIGESFIKAFNFKEVIQNVIQSVEQFANWFSNLSDGAQRFIMVSAAVVASIGPIILIVGKIIGLGASMAGTLKTINGAFKVLNATMAANPMLIWVAAIGAAIAIIVTLWKRCETFRAVVKFVAQSAAAYFQTAWVNIKMGAEMMWLAIKTYFTAIPKAAAAMWNIVKRAMKGENIGDAIKDEFGKIVNGVKDNASEIRAKYAAEFAAIKAPNYKEILAKERAQKVGEEAGEAVAAGFNTAVETKLDVPPVLGGGGSAKPTRPTEKIEKMKGIQASQFADKGIGVGDAFGLQVDKLKEHSERYAQIAAELQDNSVFVDLGSMIQDSLGSAFETIGKGLGDLASGTASAGDVFKSLLGVVFEFTSALGKALIASGLGGIAFKKLIANPVAAIAAGTALVALSSLASGLLSKGPGGGGGDGGGGGSVQTVPAFANGGMVHAPTVAMVGDNPGARFDPEVIAPFSKLEKLLGGGGGMPSTIRLVAAGDQLEAVMDFRNKRMRNLR